MREYHLSLIHNFSYKKTRIVIFICNRPKITPNSTTVDAQKTQSTLKITSRLGTKSRTSNQSSIGQRRTQFITLVEFHPARKSPKLSEPSLKVSRLATLLTSVLWTPLLSLQLATVRTWPILSIPHRDVI